MPHVARTGAISSVIGFVAWSAVAAAGPLDFAQGRPDRRVVEAAKARDLATVRMLIAERADVTVPQGDGATALHWAAHWDDAAIADVLIGAGARVNAADDHGVTPLALACLNGSTAMVERLLKAGANPSVASIVGETPLMIAAHTGNATVVAQLLTHGAAHSEAENSLGQTALMRAVVENHVDVVRTLLAAGADAKARSKNRFTPLLFATQQGNIEIARLLTAAGADVNEAAPDGIAGDTNAGRSFKPDTEASALLVAIDSQHEAMAKFLLDSGANPNHHGAGRTALHSAVQQAMPELVRVLLAHGADPNARLTRPMPFLSRLILQAHGLEVSTIGSTPFWLAASYGDVRTMRILVEGGADPLARSSDNTTPLMVAAGVDFVEGQDKYGRRWFASDTAALQQTARDAVAYCLELGDDINAANDQGQTPIVGAVYFRSPGMVQFLVDRGAKINVVNKRGQTPWLITQGEYRSGSFFVDKETGDSLVKLGADVTLGKDLGPEFRKPAR
jgi:ankyrin repeat protein